MIRPITLASFIFFLLPAKSQTLIFEQNFGGGVPAAWTQIDGDGLTHAPAAQQYGQGWFDYYTLVDSCVASNSYYAPAGQSADYLISPKISLSTFSKLVWSARSYDASYPDDYLVLISATDSLIGSFTDTLMMVAGESPYWLDRSVQLDLEGYTSQDVYIAFKNITYDGFLLLIDNFKVLGSDFASVSNEPEKNFTVYPNPCTDEVTIQNFVAGDVVTIYGIDGSVMTTSTQGRVNVSSLASGTYLVNLVSGDKVSSTLLVKE